MFWESFSVGMAGSAGCACDGRIHAIPEFPQITFSILKFLSISQDDNPQLNSKLKMMRDVEYCDIYDVYVISVFRFLPVGIV